MTPLKLAVVLACAWCAVALFVEFRRAKAFGMRRLFAPAAGDAAAGARYAFTKGMAPQAKESVRRNPFSYAAGMLYHCGVFAAFALLALHVLGVSLNVAGLHLSRVFAGMAMAGTLGGMALFAKRLLKAHLRGLSVPDDFFSNLLVTSFTALAGTVGFAGTTGTRPTLESVWLFVAIALDAVFD